MKAARQGSSRPTPPARRRGATPSPASSATTRDASRGGRLNLQLKGQNLVDTLWQIDVIGESRDGSRSYVEIVEGKVLSAGY